MFSSQKASFLSPLPVPEIIDILDKNTTRSQFKYFVKSFNEDILFLGRRNGYNFTIKAIKGSAFAPAKGTITEAQNGSKINLTFKSIYAVIILPVIIILSV
jgi:hypothetical protein